ncbi:MAG: LptF/LptG family permease, partial [Bacteriovoracaceae bacterium]|nr:LptF/LptG family permease [Bacteriovoracaceae bacterium]
MLKIPQKYLIINFIPPFLVSLFFWVSFLIIFQLFRIIGVVINKGVDVWVFLSIIGNIALSFFPIAVPLSIFFAVFFCLNKFSEDSEIIAMRSFGMTRFDLFKPFLITGIFLALGMMALVQNIIPNANRQYRNSVILLTSRGMMNEIKKGEFFTDIPKVILFAEDVTNKGNHLHNVFIQTKGEAGKGERIIFAQEGILKKIVPKKDFGFPEVRLLLKNGSIFQGKGDNTNTVYFKDYDYPVISGGLQYHTIYRNTMMSSGELWDRMNDEAKLKKELDAHRARYSGSYLKKKIKQIRSTW